MGRFCCGKSLIIVDLRINETLQTGAVRKPHLPFSPLVGTVSNSADAVRLETAPTGWAQVYLFLEFTIVHWIGFVGFHCIYWWRGVVEKRHGYGHRYGFG